eukprot:CAMPEP_0179065316 /NCGR_PEP_ID=MMETSP0796-20121207/28396_1 /TAXON_ID=73915 /ORGANISM="Pyrodinium bahamense, Strain pbaha01" /LENGTH=511 /DNA_ID=CAMNT_0020762281 /DNA_START=78 /DNA_END=1613 /DNA_ORIENTATION=+
MVAALRIVRLPAAQGIRQPFAGTPPQDSGGLAAWCQHYRTVGTPGSAASSRTRSSWPSFKQLTRIASVPGNDVEAAEPQGVSVDGYLALAGGWGRFQTRLAVKVALVYAFVGIDSLFAAFLSPALGAQWNLSLVQQQLLSSLWFIGGLMGFLLSGVVADARGRRAALVLFSLVHRVGDVLTFLSPSFWAVLAARMLTSVGAVGTFNVLYPLVAEYSPPKYRARAKQMLGFAWNAGVLVLVAIAFAVRAWPWQALALAVVPGIFATAWLLRDLPESPRFLWMQGRDADAMRTLQVVARTNGKSPGSARLMSAPQRSADGPWVSMLHGLFCKEQRFRTIALLFLNFVCSAAYYGLCFAPVVGLGSGLYLGQLSATVLEVPALLLTAPLADRLGRRWSLAGLVTTSGLALFMLATGPAGSAVTGTPLGWTATLLARCTGQSAASLKWVVNAENFPTSARGAGMALAGICGSLGGFIGPLVFATSSAPFALLGVLCLPAAVCALSLPETAKRELD